VSVAFFGDGASNNGAFHEGLNMAAIWALPVLFVCENNHYATEVPFRTVAGNPDVTARGVAYGIPSPAIDGNDVLAVYSAAAEAVARARAGEGPTLLVCSTYRTRAHAEGMRDTGYRTREEVDQWRARDPIKLLRQRIVDSGAADEAMLQSMEGEVAAETEEALAWAKDSPWPDPATVLDHVYA
jgi:2-oxoisovalerate dehydrogenase E1 component